MTATRTAKPARKPGAVTRASWAQRTTKPGVRKTAAKPAAKSAKSDKPLAAELAQPGPVLPAKISKAVVARKKTIASTSRRVDETPVAVDERDEAAKAGISQQRARRASIRRKDEPSPRVKRTAVERVDDPPPAAGGHLIERVTSAIERELLKIEVIVGGGHVKTQQRTEAERRARTLASLARTLGEVTRLRAGQQKVKPADDDAVPRDLDEFRRTLSRRLEQLVTASAPVSAGEHE